MHLGEASPQGTLARRRRCRMVDADVRATSKRRCAIRPTLARASGGNSESGITPVIFVVISACLLCACAGEQSALDPAGEDAERIAHLFWIMLGGAALIWALVIGGVVYATRTAPDPHSARTGNALLLWGGLVVPTLTLAGLLIYGLVLMAELRAAGDGLKIAVSGEQWWWRVRYHMPEADGPVDQRERGPAAASASGSSSS